ncbi:MAG TPA: hypothetical protein VFK54_08780 [Candidatus Limnocylindrales bacterium]|nr:hypothetical protein [Candidatus Limnocylindrales bacterium]
MEPLAVLSLVLFAALAVAFVAFLRRANALVTRIRAHERFQAEVAALDGRAGQAIDPLLARIEDVRHHRAHAAPLDEHVAVTRQRLDEVIREVGALRPVPSLLDAPAALIEAYTRADRALRLVEHGVAGLAATRGGPRELEAQTSLKRGTLALRNARADAAVIARRVAETRPPGTATSGLGVFGRTGGAGSARTSGAASRVVVPPPPSTLISGSDERSDPSM